MLKKFDLKKERVKAGMTQLELARRTGFSTDTIQRAEKDKDHRLNAFFLLWFKELKNNS